MKFFILTIIICQQLMATTYSLKEWYQLALKNNQSYQREFIEQNILGQTKKQLLSATLPQISLDATYNQREPSSRYTNTGLDDTTEVVTIRGTQRLFSGLKEYYTLRGVKFQIEAKDWLIKAASLNLLENLSTLYFTAWLEQQRILNITELLSLSKDRENLLKRRVNIGKSRKTELLQATVQSSSYQLSLEQAQLSLAQTWSKIEAIVATPIKPGDLKSLDKNFSNLEPLTNYLAKIDAHPLIQAEEKNISSLHEEKKSLQSDYWPSIDLKSNYYVQTANSTSSNSINPEWDVGIAISMPIFEGGLTRAQVAESALKEARSHVTLAQLKLDLEADIKSVYQAIKSQKNQQIAIDEMVKANKLNYNEIKREYNIGLVNSLDVVATSNTYILSLEQREQNFAQMQLNFVTLKTLTGEEL